MNIITVTNGADLNNDGSLILVTMVNGRVELRKESGSTIRTIVTTNAVSARFSGKDLLIKLNNGKTELRKESGSIIRTL